ncbi:hypothetical protein D9611_001084 [Ephemerocybe angulata]|uniref:F-box domain-containing protein n=1 Tax=Ephemerocybe angulata TaxID=980116 RepID=A0A8H5CIT1_9AGAR|nr:hypothetical protein D9611_001084 [Tulosesus angulatus]
MSEPPMLSTSTIASHVSPSHRGLVSLNSSHQFQGRGDLPSDVWLEILSLLHYREFFSINRVCKVLHDLIDQRDIWVHALRGMCQQHAVFLPSYPIEDMDVRELQRAVTGPARFTALTRNHKSTTLDEETPTLPFSSIFSLSLDTRSIWTDIGSEGMFLVPGGRFLITANDECLVLSDLGAAGRQPFAQPLILAEQSYRTPDVLVGSIEEADIHFLHLGVVSDGENRLRIIVALHDSTANTVTFLAYEIALPCVQQSRFTRLGVLRIAIPEDMAQFMGGGTGVRFCKVFLISGKLFHVEIL